MDDNYENFSIMPSPIRTHRRERGSIRSSDEQVAKLANFAVLEAVLNAMALSTNATTLMTARNGPIFGRFCIFFFLIG